MADLESLAIRIPPLFGLGRKIPVDVLGLHKTLQALYAQLAGVAAHTAKGAAIIVGQGAIYSRPGCCASGKAGKAGGV